ncbi:ribosomal protein S7 domain-containing protein, partial [Chytriomyces sp. MP71]
ESPLISAFVNNIMKSGKKATARRIVSDALKHIQLESGSNPHHVLASAIEKVEPLFKVEGAMRGAKSVQTPRPLTERQRRRTAIIWITDAAQKRNRKDPAGIRIGKEVLAVLNDESAAIQKRNQVHKNALMNRSNLVLVDRRI